MTIGQKWDISQITPCQWEKLTDEAARLNKNVWLYWDGKRTIKRLDKSSFLSSFRLMSIADLWKCSKEILAQNTAWRAQHYRKESRVWTGAILRHLNSLAISENRRILNLPYISQNKKSLEIYQLREGLYYFDQCLDPSTFAGSDEFTQAVRTNDYDKLTKLVLYGANLENHLYSLGLTPLTYVIEYNPNPRITELLLPDSDVFQPNVDSSSAFQHLLRSWLRENRPQGIKTIFSQIIEHLKKIPEKEKNALASRINKELEDVFSAANGKMQIKNNNDDFLDKYLSLLEMLKPLGANSNLFQPPLLTTAMLECNRPFAEKLIKSDADIRLTLKQLGLSKLMLAAFRGDLEAVKRILTPRTRMLLGNAKDKAGNTALIWAARMGHKEVVKYLIELGVNLDAKNKQGHTAHQIASSEIQSLLWVAGAQTEHGVTILMARAWLDHFTAEDFKSLTYDYVNKKSTTWHILNNPIAGFTALHCCVAGPPLRPFFDNLYSLKKLINAGADINATNSDGCTPLMLAVVTQKEEHVQELIRVGAGLDFKNKCTLRAYDLACLASAGPKKEKIINMLNFAGAKDKEGLNYLMRAVLECDETLVDIIIAAGFNLDAQIDDKNHLHGETALSLAIEKGHYAIAEKLLKAGAKHNIGKMSRGALEFLIQVRQKIVYVGTKDIEFANILINKFAINLESTTPLQFEIWKQNLEGFEKLINSSEIDLNEINADGKTAIHFAVLGKNWRMLKELIRRNADVNLGQPLIDAMHIKETDSINWLLDAGANANVRDPVTKESLLMMSMRTWQWTFLYEKIIRNGADLNEKDELGNSLLHNAIHDNNIEQIDLLLKKGIDVNVQNNEGDTSFHLAVKKEDLVTAAKLIRKTLPDIKDKRGHPPLIAAIEKFGSKYDLSAFLLPSTINVKDMNGYFPLMWAASNGCVDLVDKLIHAGADLDAENMMEQTTVSYLQDQLQKLEGSEINPIYQVILSHLLKAGARDILGRTPLMCAILIPEEKEAYAQVKEWLRKNKESINAEDYAGMTAAMYAAKRGNVPIFELLVEAGADILMQDRKGRTVLSYDENGRINHQKYSRSESPESILQDKCLFFLKSHFNVVEEIAPVRHENVNLNNLLTMFDQINIKEPKKPGYLNPARIKDDGAQKTLPEIRASLEQYVRRIKNKEAFLATPPAGSQELLDYYANLENTLAFIIQKISEPSFDPDVRTSVLFDLAIAGGHCGTRYKTEAAAWHKLLKQGTKGITLTLKEEIEKILQNMRLGIIESMSKKMVYSDGRRINIGNRPHTYNQIVRTIGKSVGIPGVSETYYDQACWIKDLSESDLSQMFNRDYTPTKVIDRINAAINGGFEIRPSPPEILPAAVDLWLKDRMPADWKLREPLSFTVIEQDGVEKSLDFLTFTEVVRKEFEAEKKRVESLTDEEIAKEGKKKIRNYLFSLYRLTFNDDVDLHNWEQVKWAIREQLDRLKGGYRSLLKQPEKLADIKAYIEKMKDRQNYLNFALRGVVNNFGILPPSVCDDWDAVKLALGNMRRQEYVDTQIRGGGYIPRSTIKAMLIDMGVLVESSSPYKWRITVIPQNSM